MYLAHPPALHFLFGQCSSKLQIMMCQTLPVCCASQLRLRTGLMIFYTLCLVLLWYVASKNCASPQFTWMGIMPMQVSLSNACLLITSQHMLS